MTIRVNPILLIIIIAFTMIDSCTVLQPNKMFKTEKNFQYNEFEPESKKEYRIQPYDIIGLSINTNDGYKSN
jgi:hypothetical protein